MDDKHRQVFHCKANVAGWIHDDAIKRHRGVQVQEHAFLTPIPDGVQWSALSPACFILE
jgi:hypothetical protein